MCSGELRALYAIDTPQLHSSKFIHAVACGAESTAQTRVGRSDECAWGVLCAFSAVGSSNVDKHTLEGRAGVWLLRAYTPGMGRAD